MDISSLTERLKYSLRKNEVLQMAHFFCEHPNGVSKLFEISISNSKEQAFHAAWVLENCLLERKGLLDENAIRLARIIPQLTNNSVKRHFCKMFNVWLRGNPSNVAKLVKNNMVEVERLIETNFDWLTNENVPVAVKAHCIEILAVLSEHVEWLKDELHNVFRLVQMDASPGIRARVSRVQKNIEFDNET